MGEGIQRYLSAFERSGVAAPFRNQRVGGFVAGRGKQEDHVLEESKRKLIGGHGKPQYTGPILALSALSSLLEE